MKESKSSTTRLAQSEQVSGDAEHINLLKPRIDYRSVDPSATKSMMSLQNYVNNSSLPLKLLELVRIRVSQLNGCAYCLDMHTKDARAEGETEQRIYLLSAWRESPFYTDRERAALEWTEAVTLISESHVPDETYERARSHFDEKELI